IGRRCARTVRIVLIAANLSASTATPTARVRKARALNGRSADQNKGRNSDPTGTAPIAPIALADRIGHNARIGRTVPRDPINRGLTDPIVRTVPFGFDRTVPSAQIDRIPLAQTVPNAHIGTALAART
ncbi:hypothetical protein LTR94_032576, partial [Friedmanniomyces endolithicus]